MLAGAGPRDATRGGVNLAAPPRERGREGPLWIDGMAETVAWFAHRLRKS
jgi:hypothetical protein